jgi:putative flippase GtrA
VKSIVNQLILFAAVGAIGTAFHFATLIILVQFGTTDPVSASMAGFAVGALVNYWLNYHITFRSNCRHHIASPKFFAIALAGLGLNTLIMVLLIGQWHYLLSQALATTLVLLWNFLCNRYWTFRGDVLEG